jgi:alpha-2-macroglobulin
MFTLLIALFLSQTTAVPSWESINKLIDEAKIDSAVKAVESRVKAASGDDELGRALLMRAKLRVMAGATETAISELRAAVLPKASVPRALVNVYLAQVLSAHLSNYGWEIDQREKVVAEKKDLKQWTRREFLEAIGQAWKSADDLKSDLNVPLSKFEKYISRNDFPDGVRSSLRDFVALQRAAFLAQTASWTEDEISDVYRLGLDSLLADTVTSTETHSLVQAIKVLNELERWHLQNQQIEGALFARVTRLSTLHQAFSEAATRGKIDASLKAVIDSNAQVPLSAWARAERAQWLLEESKVQEARDVALVGAKAFPVSVGGKRCISLVAQLEAPAFEMSLPLTDGPNKKSLNLTAKNLKSVFVRIIRLNRETFWKGRGYQALPDQEFLKANLQKSADAQLSVELPATPDLQMHRTQVQMPNLKPGIFLVAVSAREDFKDQANRIEGATFIVSDLALTTLVPQGLGPVSVVVRRGVDGTPVNGAKVRLYSFAWNSPPHVVGESSSDDSGFAVLNEGLSQNQQYFVTAQKDDQFSLDAAGFSRWPAQPERTRDEAFIYTDRAVYRPGQKLQWKVVAFNNNSTKIEYRVKPKTNLKVKLTDGNGQEVAQASVTTNEFGSASGSFEIPTGKSLGAWYLSAHGAGTSVQVEEYKRPTFEVTFEDSKTNNRLNSQVSLKGLAKSYFGMAVSTGKVRWKVTREPEWPRWCWYFNPPHTENLVAGGAGVLGAQGEFSVSFLPEVNPALPKDVNYLYRLQAEVTDDRGETRKAEKTFRLGLVGIVSEVEVASIQTVKEKFVARMKRLSIDREGRGGEGTWKVLTLVQPKSPVLAADDTVMPSPFDQIQLLTPGDKIKGRGAVQNDAAAQMRAWADGELVSSGKVQHAADGSASVDLTLPSGVYRLKHETKDDAGAAAQSVAEFVVLGPQINFMVPLFSALVSETSQVGETAQLRLHSGFENQMVLVEVVRENTLLEKRWLKMTGQMQLVSRKISGEDRGGIHFRVSMVRDWQLVSQQWPVDVPYRAKELSLSFASFRDTLKPGEKETFRVFVKREGKSVEAQSTEALASMYDQSLDALATHQVPRPELLYPKKSFLISMSNGLLGGWPVGLSESPWYLLPQSTDYRDDSLIDFPGGMGLNGAGFGGGGRGRGGGMMRSMAAEPESLAEVKKMPMTMAPAPPPASPSFDKMKSDAASPANVNAPAAAVQLRTNFAETAIYW